MWGGSRRELIGAQRTTALHKQLQPWGCKGSATRKVRRRPVENLTSPWPGVNEGSLSFAGCRADPAGTPWPSPADMFIVGPTRFPYDPPLAKMLDVRRETGFPLRTIDV